MPTLGQLLMASVEAQYGKELDVVVKALTVPRENLLHLGLDPHFTPDGYVTDREMFMMVANSALDTASCYPTAETLYPIIAADVAEHGGIESGDLFTEADKIRTAVTALVTAIRQAVAGGHATVFRVEYAAHGFTLVVRKPDEDAAAQVELIETVAHGAMITPSLGRPALAPETVVGALAGMADDAMATRKQAAGVLGWDAVDFWLAEKVDNDPVFPNIKFRWWSGALRPDAIARWTDMFAARLKLFTNVTTL